ncbi:MAG: hypothetical protein GY906_29915 [bacterium]|nr:hypothetical protein [bacterium]
MGKKRKHRRKNKGSSSRTTQRKARYSPFEIFLAVLGAAILVFVAILVIGAIFGS